MCVILNFNEDDVLNMLFFVLITAKLFIYQHKKRKPKHISKQLRIISETNNRY